MANDLSPNVCSPATPKWIAGRVETLLSHYPSKATATEVEEAAMMDWVKALSGYSQAQISQACDAYIRDSEWRPRPADIIRLIKSQRGKGASRLSGLTNAEAEQVHGIIERARRHVSEFPPGSALHEAGKSTIAFWEAAE